MKKIFLLISCTLLLQSCISTYGSGTPEGVKVYTTSPLAYFMKDKTMEEASKHCAKFNKKAVFVETTYLVSKNEYKCVSKK